MKQGPLTDTEFRQAVYRWVISRGEIPPSNQIAHAAGISKQEVLDSFARLADAHVLVLQKNGEILMAMPFSAVPTPVPDYCTRTFTLLCKLRMGCIRSACHAEE